MNKDNVTQRQSALQSANTITFTWEEALRAAHLPVTRVVPQASKPKTVAEIRAAVR